MPLETKPVCVFGVRCGACAHNFPSLKRYDECSPISTARPRGERVNKHSALPFWVYSFSPDLKVGASVAHSNFKNLAYFNKKEKQNKN